MIVLTSQKKRLPLTIGMGLQLQQWYYSCSKKWHGINSITVGITIALVIERKKLSPEARKQTRASESLKITSKINFKFPIIFVHYSPGDRAQKVIPGGAKTNESF